MSPGSESRTPAGNPTPDPILSEVYRKHRFTPRRQEQATDVCLNVNRWMHPTGFPGLASVAQRQTLRQRVAFKQSARRDPGNSCEGSVRIAPAQLEDSHLPKNPVECRRKAEPATWDQAKTRSKILSRRFLRGSLAELAWACAGFPSQDPIPVEPPQDDAPTATGRHPRNDCGRAAVNSTSSAILLEAMMSRVITFDKGSKRRLKQI
jgi:hypothetical protein